MPNVQECASVRGLLSYSPEAVEVLFPEVRAPPEAATAQASPRPRAASGLALRIAERYNLSAVGDDGDEEAGACRILGMLSRGRCRRPRTDHDLVPSRLALG